MPKTVRQLAKSKTKKGRGPTNGQRPRVVWPKEAAEQKFVFPRPKV